MPSVRARIVGGLLGLALTAGLSACSSDDGGQALPASPQIDADAPPLDSFELYALASADGSESRADVYGITLSPMRAYRLTATTRVSWLTADADRVVVAAADEQFDKLGQVAAGGAIVPIPGLGRPSAFSPEIQADGTIRYEDNGVTEAINTRYLSFDPRTQKKRVLFTSKEDYNIGPALPGGGFLGVVQETGLDDQILLMTKNGVQKTITVAPRIAAPLVGKSLIAAAVFGSANVDEPPTDTALITTANGKVRIITGWAPLGWTPNRTKLLVVRAGSPARTDAELAVLDPADAAQPEVLGTLPGLTLFSATWVDRETSPGD